ncbi:hypothetical protein FISHEDRAFT_78980, partial [Fistulina hepatica ATCC 64428]
NGKLRPATTSKAVKILKRPVSKPTTSEPAPVAPLASKPTDQAKLSKASTKTTWINPYHVTPAPLAPPARAPVPAYHNTAPIEDDDTARTIYEAILDGETIVKNKHLLSIAPEVRRQIRDATTAHRVVAQPLEVAQPTVSAAKLPAKAVATDPIVSYYQGQPSSAPPPVIKGAASSALRTVMPLVNSVEEESHGTPTNV